MLHPCLDSLKTQGLTTEQLQIVAIDDGSTDGSGEVLDAYAASRPGVVVVHQAHSGWPGGPRNRGIERSVGRYLFFLDADDRLAPGALCRLTSYADEHAVDVLIPRISVVGATQGRAMGPTETEDPCALPRAIRAVSPQKLIRRSLVDEHAIRFPEGHVRLEDGIFVAHVLMHARRVAVLDGEMHYLKTKRRQGNISRTPMSVAGYVGSMRTMIDIIQSHEAPTDVTNDAVVNVYRHRGLKRMTGQRLLNMPKSKRREWIVCLQQLTRDVIDHERQLLLPPLERLRSELVRHAAERRLLALAEAEVTRQAPVVVRTWRGTRARFGRKSVCVTGLLEPGEPVVTGPFR